jgi:5-formyltetrahydrofolate cyclo-ligase
LGRWNIGSAEEAPKFARCPRPVVLAFDRKGFRLGYGGFMTALESCGGQKATAIGIAYAGQEVDSSRDAFDSDWIGS